jgi:hypothetical protein
VQPKRYFVDYWAYFGEVGHETFGSWREMAFFLRQLRPDAVLDYGEIRRQSGAEKRAA